MSCARLDQNSISTSFAEARCDLLDRANGNAVLGSAVKRDSDGLPVTKLALPNETKATSFPAAAKKFDEGNGPRLWHRRLGHVAMSTVRNICNVDRYRMNITEQVDAQNCITCVVANQPKRAMTGNLVQGGEEHVVHNDICGPFKCSTKGGSKYFVKFIVATSRYGEVSLLRSRSEMHETLFNFIAWLQRNTSVSVKRIHRDNAKEYVALDARLN